jgi:hypothetical protein
MIDIEWGDLHVDADVRAEIEARLRTLDGLGRQLLTLRARGHGFEARVRTSGPGRGATLRLHGGDLAGLIERTVELLGIVALETRRQRAESHATS